MARMRRAIHCRALIHKELAPTAHRTRISDRDDEQMESRRRQHCWFLFSASQVYIRTLIDNYVVAVSSNSRKRQ